MNVSHNKEPYLSHEIPADDLYISADGREDVQGLQCYTTIYESAPVYFGGC